MKWRGGRAGGRVEDRRGMGGAVAGGGIGLALLGLIGYYFFGIDPQTTQQVANQFGAGQQQEGQVGTPEDEAGRFVDVIGSNVNDVWSRTLDGYQPPNVVIYDQGTGTGCGYGQSAMGPFYCPLDQTIYLDLDFFGELERRFGASGDFAQAYVIAHEVGHHVQTLLGVSAKVQAARQLGQNVQGDGGLLVRQELQADCYAGVWGHRAQARHQWLEAGDIEEALSTASAIGDDALQRQSQGQVVPDAFSHGTSEQRLRWFRAGFDSGDPTRCDTFSALTL